MPTSSRQLYHLETKYVIVRDKCPSLFRCYVNETATFLNYKVNIVGVKHWINALTTNNSLTKYARKKN